MDKKILEIVKKSLDKWPKELKKEIDFLKAFDGMVELNQELTKAKVEKSLDLVVGLAEKAYGEQTQEILMKSHGSSALVSYREEDPSLQAELEKSWEKKTEIDFSEYDEKKKNFEEDGLEKGRGKDLKPRKKKLTGHNLTVESSDHKATAQMAKEHGLDLKGFRGSKDYTGRYANHKIDVIGPKDKVKEFHAKHQASKHHVKD